MNNAMTNAGVAAKGALMRFQDDLARALLGTDTEEGGRSAIAALTEQPGFTVYRNTVMKGCVDALQANYPAVARLVGDDWFRAAAALYVRAHPPGEPMLFHYGETFVQFLAEFAPARELPYLADVARLDRLWIEAHVACDETPVAAHRIADLPPEELGRITLCPHASARWAWFDAQPIATIWRRNRAEAGECLNIMWQGEGILIVRPRHAVTNIDLDAAGCAFLDACASGCALADAAVASLSADPAVDLSRLIARLLEAGAFGRIDYISEKEIQ